MLTRDTLLLLILVLLPLTAVAEDQYLVRFSEDLETVTVKACFEGAAPGRLYRHRQASDYTRWVRWDGGDITSRHNSSRLNLPTLPKNSCISWNVDLARAAAAGDYRLAMRSGNSIVSTGALWFWRDRERRAIRVQVDLPAGWSFSTPWKSLQLNQPGLFFAVESTPSSWTSRIAVGEFPLNEVKVEGGHLRLAMIGRLSLTQREDLIEWMQTAANSVASVFGSFPRQQPQVLLIASGAQREVVPWAHVMRGGGMAAEFFIDEGRSLQEFNEDWTATHELSHMLLPYVGSEDRWFSEGLASYYQNVLRARDGRLSEQSAWAKLHNGFERGKAATRGGSLAGATRSGGAAIMRIYWSGAAMMLEADARLRALTDGEQSLDTALAAFNACCFDPGRRWQAKDIFVQLDQITGYRVFSDLYDEHVPNTEFPDISETYQQLGLEPDNRTIQINPGAPWSHIRYFIMNEPQFNSTQSARPSGSGSP